MTPEEATLRRERANDHAEHLSLLLEQPNTHGVKSRVFRARYWHDDQLMGVAIVQRFNVPDGTPALTVLTIRGYQHFPATEPRLDLIGRYSTFAIVAFLQLDTLDPTAVEWADETPYILLPPIDAVLEKYR